MLIMRQVIIQIVFSQNHNTICMLSCKLSGILDHLIGIDIIVEMLRTFKNNGLLNRISEVSLKSDNTYRIITVDGTVFTVKDLDNFHDYFGYIKTVVENGESELDINLTAGNNPIQKPRS